MRQNLKCPGKNQGDKFKYIFDLYSFYHHRRCWSTFIQYLPTMYLISVGLPIRFNVGPAMQPISVSMPVNHLWRWPNSKPSPAVYFAQTRGIHPMLVQCWPTVFEAGPSLKHHWVIVQCFLSVALWWRFFVFFSIFLRSPTGAHFCYMQCKSCACVHVQSVYGLTQQVGRGTTWQGCETNFLSLGPDVISLTSIRLTTGPISQSYLGPAITSTCRPLVANHPLMGHSSETPPNVGSF